jgi:hypothetical protein
LKKATQVLFFMVLEAGESKINILGSVEGFLLRPYMMERVRLHNTHTHPRFRGKKGEREEVGREGKRKREREKERERERVPQVLLC